MAEQGEGHAAHDPFAVAALLDPDVAPADREVGENLIASCPDCATLHADLVALSSATAGLPAPARPRDFRLTAEDAVRLAASSPGEPVVATARLAGMTPRTSAADHAGHDPLLVASLVDHSLEDRERSAAEALVAACTACAGLHADILALRDATRAMPTPARPRDYALTPDDAVRLRRGGWRRLVAAFGSSRDAFSRPLAMGLTTLGIAGLLFATIPSIYTGGAASGSATTAGARAGDVAQPGTDSNGAPVAAASQGVTGAGAPAPVGAPAATAVPAQVASPLPDAAASAPAATAPAKEAFGPVQGAGGAAAPPSVSDFGIRGGGQGPTGAQALGEGGAATGASGAPLLLVVSGLFLVVGLSLFAIRWSARRLGDG